ncbi:MAG TPA: DUF4345 domain-containing protein [Stellaceae bacterium]|nr:DUF4345 domain-containing protein [Stellaceae bacterium]
MSERRALQIAVAIASLVPIFAGGAGVLLGPAMTAMDHAPTAVDSHFRYLSGLLLGIGLAFVTTIPRIDTHTVRFRGLGAIVVIGGLGRLLSLVLHGYPGAGMLFGLVMELAVTPALVLWQGRVARR